MAYTSISSTLYNVGRAVRRELFNLIIGNQEDIQSRLNAVEQSQARVSVFNTTVYNSRYASSLENILLFTAPSDFSVVSAKLSIFEQVGAPYVGNLEIDIVKASDLSLIGGNSIFDVKPSIDIASASAYDSDSGTLNPTFTGVSTGDILALSVTSLPSGGVYPNFKIDVYGEA